MSPDELWNLARPLFEEDEGLLPGIAFDNLSPREVVAIYARIRDGTRVYPPGASFWIGDETSGASRHIQSVPNAAEWVVCSAAQPFHHCVQGLRIADVELPDLGVFVFPDAVELDYRKGPAWSARQVASFFRLLSILQRLAQHARPRLKDEAMDREPELFDQSWQLYQAQLT